MVVPLAAGENEPLKGSTELAKHLQVFDGVALGTRTRTTTLGALNSFSQ